MQVELKDFIGVYSNVLPDGACAHLISEFEANIGFSKTRQEAENVASHVKKDQAIFVHDRNLSFNPAPPDSPIAGQDVKAVFWHGLQNCYEDYAEKFSVLRDGDIFCNSFKMQKTSEGGGYHVWHCENLSMDVTHRVVTYMLYLNTLPEGSNGETEFLYQKRRVRPTENTMVLWPAGYTHPHRGNPVYGNTAKYIITGWFVLR